MFKFKTKIRPPFAACDELKSKTQLACELRTLFHTKNRHMSINPHWLFQMQK